MSQHIAVELRGLLKKACAIAGGSDGSSKAKRQDDRDRDPGILQCPYGLHLSTSCPSRPTLMMSLPGVTF
jgi:hypothetical protein